MNLGQFVPVKSEADVSLGIIPSIIMYNWLLAGQRYRFRVRPCLIEGRHIEALLACLVKQETSGSGLAAASVAHSRAGIQYPVSCGALSLMYRQRALGTGDVSFPPVDGQKLCK